LLRTPPADGAPPHPYVPELGPGAVQQPAHVRALRSGEWKLVRYCDPWSEQPVADEWEMYNLAHDPIENINLLIYNGAFPTVIPASSLPSYLDAETVAAKASELREELARQEAALLSPYPSAHPSARA
jgi:hypothetical protein